MTLDPLSFALGAFAGLLLAVAFFASKISALKSKLTQQGAAKTDMENAFSAAAMEALNKSGEHFLRLAKEKLEAERSASSHEIDRRHKAISELVDPVRDHLKRLNESVEQIKGTDKALRDDLLNLRHETARLTGALRDPAARGKWGEFILERLLDKSGLIKGLHYESQVTLDADGGRLRPDFIIRLQDSFSIVVDAKAPINEFAERLTEQMDEATQRDLLDKLARQVREHVRKLGSKAYWENLDSPDFVVMFLPSEALFSAAVRADPELIDFAGDQRIVIVSPTLMMSLLRVVHLSWRQVELARNAQDISAQGAELYKRLTVFAGHVEKVGKGLESAISGYNNAIGSLERNVLPQAWRMKDLGVQTGGKELAELQPIEQTARVLSLPTRTDEGEAA
jgi:DNA recombination protein RmuC